MKITATSSILPVRHLDGPFMCHLVVPHHGGKAGKINAKLTIGVPGKAVVSTEANCYGHPFNEVCKKICHMGFTWLRTDYLGNVELHL